MFVARFDVEGGEFDEREIGLHVGLVAMDDQTRPADGRLVGELDVSLAGGAGVGAMEVGVIARDVRGEA